MDISNELLAAYAEDNVSREERLAVRRYLTGHPEELEPLLTLMDTDSDITLDGTTDRGGTGFLERLDALADSLGLETGCKQMRVLPMTAMAADNNVNSLCVVRCEGIALRSFGLEVSDEELIEESRAAGWLRAEGTALHDIGRLSGTRGLSVAHRYDCSLDDVRQELARGRVVIAVVDQSELAEDWEEISKAEELEEVPNHAVVITAIDGDAVILQDSSTPQQTDAYPVEQFEDAWADSSNYLIIISNDNDYEPHPIDLSDVEIPEDLTELREAIAENAHEVWAANRKREGWTYGPVRDDARKQHPDMIPYNLLPDSEKAYDREMALNTIKLLRKLGWEIVKR